MFVHPIVGLYFLAIILFAIVALNAVVMLIWNGLTGRKPGEKLVVTTLITLGTFIVLFATLIYMNSASDAIWLNNSPQNAPAFILHYSPLLSALAAIGAGICWRCFRRRSG